MRREIEFVTFCYCSVSFLSLSAIVTEILYPRSRLNFLILGFSHDVCGKVCSRRHLRREIVVPGIKMDFDTMNVEFVLVCVTLSGLINRILTYLVHRWCIVFGWYLHCSRLAQIYGAWTGQHLRNIDRSDQWLSSEHDMTLLPFII
ncbi:uncharacterized protein LY89DRAFT_493509 [Mollisia scopiformis]|uniref:Uncharacterized protein n=1 Tax=Mollisia scopiformis TaxID=149040 RepID=A0A194XID6_MOLSC|nr:uncharacterized protein LY89DRAFT_493509 [Mollisia scopiformis]KUJ19532.1 hypothetical protein LY89DRAFT_493509 [Mollisia scopiformis]